MRFVKLQSKDVVNVVNGCKIGFISDIEIDWCTRTIQAIVVEKSSFLKLLCFFKEAPCIVIIGGDVILVTIDQ